MACLMAKEPEDRMESAEEIARALEPFCANADLAPMALHRNVPDHLISTITRRQDAHRRRRDPKARSPARAYERPKSRGPGLRRLDWVVLALVLAVLLGGAGWLVRGRFFQGALATSGTPPPPILRSRNFKNAASAGRTSYWSASTSTPTQSSSHASMQRMTQSRSTICLPTSGISASAQNTSVCSLAVPPTRRGTVCRRRVRTFSKHQWAVTGTGANGPRDLRVLRPGGDVRKQRGTSLLLRCRLNVPATGDCGDRVGHRGNPEEPSQHPILRICRCQPERLGSRHHPRSRASPRRNAVQRIRGRRRWARPSISTGPNAISS